MTLWSPSAWNQTTQVRCGVSQTENQNQRESRNSKRHSEMSVSVSLRHLAGPGGLLHETASLRHLNPCELPHLGHTLSQGLPLWKIRLLAASLHSVYGNQKTLWALNHPVLGQVSTQGGARAVTAATSPPRSCCATDRGSGPEAGPRWCDLWERDGNFPARRRWPGRPVFNRCHQIRTQTQIHANSSDPAARRRYDPPGTITNWVSGQQRGRPTLGALLWLSSPGSFS